MGDTATVARKELIELFGNRHSARGPLVQGAILVALAGVFFPASDPSFLHGGSTIATFYLIFPGVLAASVGADAFAGERERKTLETLLATPLSDRAVFGGKAAAAMSFALGAATIALVASMVTVAVRGGAPLPIEHAVTLLITAAGSAALATSIAIFVSMRVAVARSAQQIASISTMVVGVVTLGVASRLGFPLGWATLPQIAFGLIVVGIIALRAAAATFRRDRMFEDR
jgi:ABC-2 type transport system permease protein